MPHSFSLVRNIGLQLEEGIGDLEHQDVGNAVFMADQDALASSANSMKVVLIFQALEALDHRAVLLGLVLLCSKGVIRERVQTERLRLGSREVLWDDGPGCC